MGVFFKRKVLLGTYHWFGEVEILKACSFDNLGHTIGGKVTRTAQLPLQARP